MALYARSPLRNACRLASAHWLNDHVVMYTSRSAISCYFPLHSPYLCFSGTERSRLTPWMPWEQNYRCMSTARVPNNYWGLFPRHAHDRNFSPLCGYNDKLSMGPCCRYKSSRVQVSRKYCQKGEEEPKPVLPPARPSIWKRFKDMYKEYWYVLVPVHIATSIVWYGSFYYIASSGFDLVHFLENISAPDSLIKPLRNSKAGYFAIAYALYKVATPARYTVTLGGTTVAINYLRKWGYIKPMPNSAAIQQMIKDKRAAFQQGLHKRQAARRTRLKDKEEKSRSSQSGTKKP